MKVLTDLAPIPFHAFLPVVDKGALNKDSGFRFRQSFAKFFHGQIYERLFYAYPDLRLVADPFGRTEFRESFKRYVEAHTDIDLFRRSAFDWGDKSDPLLQLADVVAGSLGAALEPDQRSVTVAEFESALGRDKVTYEWWPPYQHPRNASLEGLSARNPADAQIREYCVRRAVGFIQANTGSQVDEVRCQVAAATVLLELAHTGTGEGSISNDAITERVRQMAAGVDVRSGRWFQGNVIAGLRDAGVIVTSGTQGYKLPMYVADLTLYAADVQGKVMPMLGRLKNARQQLLATTLNSVDVLAGEQFRNIREIVNTLSFPFAEDKMDPQED